MLPKMFTLLALCLLSAVTIRAQEPRRITLDGQDGVPAPVEENEKTGDGVIRQVPTPALEIYPSSGKPSHGTVLISPGGGYRVLSVEKEGRDVAKMLNAAGWDAAVLLYHVNTPPDIRELALADAEKALALLQKRGAEFGLSTARVGAMGFSAGGHLTARLAHETAAGGAGPAFLVLMYPAYLEKDGKLLDEVAPTGVPVFLCVGDKDKNYYPSSQAFNAVCQEKKIRCDYTVGPNVGHGFGLTAHLPEGVKDWPEKLKAFLASLDGKQ